MKNDRALVIAIVALCAVTTVGALLYKHTSDTKLHPACPCVDGRCPWDPQPVKPPYRPRRNGSLGEVGSGEGSDGILPRDQ